MLEDINEIRLFVEGVEGGLGPKYFQKKLGFNKQDVQRNLQYLPVYKEQLKSFYESAQKRDKWDLAPVFITGMPRSGTSLLTYLVKYFEGCNVVTYTEHSYHSLFDKNMPKGIINIVKQPYGYFEDFSKYTYQSLIKKGIRIISIVRDPRDVLVSRHELDRSKYWVEPKVVKRCAKEHLKNISKIGRASCREKV